MKLLLLRHKHVLFASSAFPKTKNKMYDLIMQNLTSEVLRKKKKKNINSKFVHLENITDLPHYLEKMLKQMLQLNSVGKL